MGSIQFGEKKSKNQGTGESGTNPAQDALDTFKSYLYATDEEGEYILRISELERATRLKRFKDHLQRTFG